MILVDTSVWIDFIRGSATEPVARLRTGLDTGVAIAITPLIYQEILQGARDDKAFRDYRAYFAGQRFLHPADPVLSQERAARLYFDCRRAGLTVRSSNDCLIAQVALEHDVPLLHDDRDFQAIAEVAPALKLT
ncbi:MAG: PIN domain-containing protein [Pseudomonadota bacterium]|nr:PIN domain-containing protein [Pseudomonadota bacterium]